MTGAFMRQLHSDGNKCTAKLMMTGHLMQNSYDAISISARRQLEYNQLLAPLFDTGDATMMMQFIDDSRPEEGSVYRSDVAPGGAFVVSGPRQRGRRMPGITGGRGSRASPRTPRPATPQSRRPG